MNHGARAEPPSLTTLDDLLVHHARVRPSATAFCDGVVARTFAELERDVSRAASGLRRLGVDARTHIALRLGDCVEWISVFLGAARLGARVHLLDVTASESVWARALRRAECRVLITDAWELAAARRIVAASWAPCTIVARGLRASEPDVVSLDALYQASAARDAHPSADHPVVHLYTSGSTGDARSVARTHAQFMAETGQVMRGLGVEPSDGIVCLPPFHHSFGLEMGVLLALRAGAPLLALPGGDGSAAPGPFPARLGALSAVIQTSVARVLLGVPYHFEALGDSDLDLSTLRWCISSAGFLASSTVDAFLTKHGRLIRSSYGSTEVGTVTLGADGLRHANTVGTPLPTVEVKILDDDDRTCAPGQTGRVVVRTAVLARGYDDPDPQQRRFLDGAFDMGDRGHIDPAGRLVLDGRSSRFLDVAGHKVDPCGVERVLESSRDVREAAVVAEGGRPGGAVVAFVVSDTLDVAGLRALCAEHLRPFEVPQRFVRLDALPRTSASKLRRRLLEEKAEESAASARSTASGTSERAASLELLQSAVVEVLERRGKPAAGVTTTRPLHEAGLDSLDLVELRRALEELTGQRLPISAFFGAPTLVELAERLTGTSAAQAPGRRPVAARSDEPLAIVSLACRFPGGISTPDELWAALNADHDALGPFPRDRGWQLDGVFDPDPNAVGRIVSSRGGFLHGVTDFDPAPFALGAREAVTLDPQQRLLLELAWEVFERAGLPPESEEGSATGVYVGLWSNRYDAREPVTRSPDGFGLLGSDVSTAAGRLAYSFGLSGPALSLDTACSSSLVAVHLACNAIRSGECERALAGGVTVHADIDPFIAFSRMRVLSPDGVCRPFSADANGTVWSEGAGLVLIEPLAAARRAGRPVLAVIRGSAINSDGRSQGLTAPNGVRQQRVINAALASAGLDADDIDVVETHGTGTALGDPVEADALRAVFHRDEAQPLHLSAVKSRLGHTQAAAGIAGLMAMVLALRHRRLPSILHLDRPTPEVQWSSGGVHALAEPCDWVAHGRPRRAGVSSFGVSGTNAHVIVEEAPQATHASAASPSLPIPLVLTADTRGALRKHAARWAAWWRQHPEVSLVDVARTAAIHRGHRPERAAITAERRQLALEALDALATERSHGALAVDRATSRGGLVFVFPGHGSQWKGMAAALYESSPAFAEALTRCDEALRAHVSWSVRDVLRDTSGAGVPPLDRVDVLQPCIFAMGISLAAALQGMGVEPAAVVGHSVGEIAAAVIAGALSLEEGARLVALRGRWIANAPGRGGMLAVQAAPAALARHLESSASSLTLAVVNAPEACVLAGDLAALEGMEERLKREGLTCGRVRIGFAAHSDHMDPILDPFVEALGELRPRSSRIAFFSSVSGARVDGAALDRGYWRRNVRSVVRFDQALSALARAGHDTFLELGGHPVLTPYLEPHGRTIVGLRRGAGDQARLARAVGALFTCGQRIEWPRWLGDGPLVPLPTYAFDRRRLWLGEATETAIMPARSAASYDELLKELSALVAESADLGAERLDPSRRIAALGLTSIELISITGRLRARYELCIEVRALVDATLAELATTIAEAAATRGAPATNRAVSMDASPRRLPPYPALALPPAARRHLDDVVARVHALTPSSRAQAHPGGPLADARVSAGWYPSMPEEAARRWALLEPLRYPLVVRSAAGAHIEDVDGNRYLDTCMGFGVHLFGHNPSFLAQAIHEAVDRGAAIGPQSHLAVDVATRLARLTGMARVAFCNTGSEAVSMALRVARARTGRDRIALTVGSFHGTADAVVATTLLPEGVPRAALDDPLLITLGDPASFDKLAEHRHTLAAVLVEPIQSGRPDLADGAFLRELRARTREWGIALILDEVLIGFRVGMRGAQGLFDVDADLVTYGKLLGGGLPIGVVAGRGDWLDHIDGGERLPETSPTVPRVFFGGTFSKNPLTMAATRAVLARLEADGEALSASLTEKTAALAGRLNRWFARAGFDARVVHAGSLYRFLLPPGGELLDAHLLLRGVYTWENRSCFVSEAHSAGDLDSIVDAVRSSFVEMRAAGWWTGRAAHQSDASPGATPVVGGSARADDPRAPETEVVSPGQARLYFLHKTLERSETYVLSDAFLVEQHIDHERLRRALSVVIGRHEQLRACFYEREGAPHQRIIDDLPPPLEVIDLRELPYDERRAAFARRHEGMIRSPFDLTRAPPWRMLVAQLDADVSAVALAWHHITSDGESFALLLDELSRAYLEPKAGDEPDATPAPSYSAYARRVRAWLAAPEAEAARRWWSDYLADASGLTISPPSAEPRRSDKGRVTFDLDADAVEGVKASARAVGCTPFVLFLAAWSLALGRQTGQSDFVVGVVSDGRDEPELRGAIGFFVNTLPLRVRIPEAPSLCSWISTLRDGLRDVLERGRLPLDEIVRLAPRGRATASALLRACISLDEADCETFAGAPITRLEETQTATGAPKFDLLLNLSRTRSGYRVALDYAPEVIDARAAQELASRVQIALASLCDDLQRPLAAVDLLTDEERERLLVGWNRAVPRSLHAGLIHAQFSALADARPERAGIVFREETWTYGQLDRHARALAQIIAPHISKAEARVAIYMERSPAAVVAILAILRCGGAFVPIDPAYPAARVRRMFAAAAIELVLSDRPHDTPAEVPVLDVRAPAWTSAAPEAPPVAAALHPLNLAYIIFTSGTTGRPKGILMTHESVMTRVDRTQRLHQLGADDRVLQNGNLSFDLFIWEIFIPLLTGATVIMSDPRRLGDFEDLAALVEREQITVARFVPAVLRLLFENARLGPWTSLRRVITGGEALSVPLMRRFLDAFPHVALYNQLGPSERPSSISWRCSPDPELRSVPIGAPLAETRVYLLDAQLRLVPPGAIGELFVGGVGLARGYLDDSRQTAASFLPDPFAEHPGARMYRTGDLARFRDDGQLVFVGRADFQVKIRGQRIELGEIERCLLSAEGVRGAVVVARTSAGGEAELVAYVAADATVEPRSLRAHARSELPLYMVPSQVVVLDALPLSENGKVDRRALPDPPAEAGTDERAYLAPRTALEQTLVDVWQATLGLARVGIEDNFFDLGGHSLLAMKLAWSVYEATGKEVRLAALFRAPTVAALAALLTEQEDGPRLVAHGPQRRVPAAPVQRGLWLHDQASRARAAYNVSWALRLRGHVDGDLLAAAFTEVVQRHAPLRTTFHALEDGLVQRIHDEPMATLRVLDLRDAPPPRDALQRRATRLFMTPLDLERAPPYRAELLRVADEEHLLLLTVHHIVADGWSFGVLFQELSRAYARRLDHRADAPAPLPVQYSDYTLWCHTRLSSAAGSADREYWLETLSDPPPPIELPCRRMTPTDERAGEQLDVPMAPEVVAGLRALGKAAHASLHPVLLTLMRTLLFRYTAQRDSIIGVFSSGRAHPMLAGLIGHFVNTLALRGELDPHQTFVEAVIAERDRLTAAYAHELYPFEWVVRDARATRRSGHVPLLDVVLVFDDREPGLPELPGVEVESLDFEAAVASDQLVLSFQATDADVHCRLTFNRHAFEREAVARMWSHLEALARAAVAFPSAPLDALDFLPERERRRLLEDFLARQPAAAPSTTLLDRFAAQVARTPENLAVTSSTGEGALTYRELDDQSRALASALARRGVTRDTPVAVLCERAPSYVVCILAVLKAGGAYVPIDPEHPRARLVDAIERAGVTLLLAPGSTSESVVDLGCEVLTMKDAAAAARDVALHSPLPGSLAYIIFTSGSSGRPKGVAITHANVVDFLDSVAFLDNGPAHALLQLMPLIFDVSTVDIWMSLTTGTRLVMFAPSVPTLDELERVVERFAITTMVPSTGLLHTIIDERPALLANMRQVLTGGDVLSPSHVARALPKLPGIMANGYGPTECTVGTSMYVMRPGDVVPPRIPIGAPFASSRVYIVDAALRLVPIGVPGELCIGGPGIARGYVGAPGMTAALFCPDPFGAPGSRMYRTGDRARYLEDGTLDFLGRLDEQVKVRGHRIELAEVQETLTRHPKVRQAAVLTHFLGTSKRLAAFVVADAPLSAGDLQGFASASLPEYMIPNDIFVLERMPHTSNGKIDRRALYGHLAAARSTERVPPATPQEARLLEIVSELLEHTELGVCDDLFDRGLDSLLAIRLVAQVSERLGFDLPVAQVFATPQIRALAAACEDRSAVHRMVLSEGSGPPLYIMPSIFGYASAFTTMTRHLREIASVGLELRVDVDPVADLQELLRHPIEEEPCVLLGYSAGGNLAFHVATTLPSDRLRAVILLDTSARQAADVREGPALDRAVAEAVRALMNTVSPDAQGSSDVRDALTPKLQALLRYHLRSYDKGCIEADLHVIVAADDDDAPSEARFAELRQGWRRCTRGAVSLHQGSGTHYEMLTQPHAARNAAIVQQIIDDLRVRS